MSEWAAGRRWSPFGSRCQRWWRLRPVSHSGSCTPRSNARYLRPTQRKKRIKPPVCWGRGGGRVRGSLTVADSGDDPKDEQPEEDVGGVAQQQDEEQADHHGYHQSPAARQTPEDPTQSDTRNQSGDPRADGPSLITSPTGRTDEITAKKATLWHRPEPTLTQGSSPRSWRNPQRSSVRPHWRWAGWRSLCKERIKRVRRGVNRWKRSCLRDVSACISSLSETLKSV